MDKDILLNQGISARSFEGLKKALHNSEEESLLLFENTKDAIFWADPVTGVITRCNRPAEALLEKTKEEIIGFSHTLLHPPEKKDYYSSMFRRHIKDKKVVDVEAEVLTGSGKVISVHITANVASIGGKEVIQGIFRDITKYKKIENDLKELNKKLENSNRRLKRLVVKDPQTGVYNHSYFEEIIRLEFCRAKEYATPLALLLLDIDYFQSINDAYGHAFGDLVLRQFAKKIRKMVRLHDYVVRFGGEEFIIILPGSNMVNSLKIAHKILTSIKMCKFGNSRTSIKLRLSLGVASYPDDKIFKESGFIEMLYRSLSKAKEYGGDRVCSSLDLKDKRPLFKKDPTFTDINYLKEQLHKITKESNQNLIESIFALVKTIGLKDQYTGDHVEKTVYYSTEISKFLNLDSSEIVLIEQASMLHDLGKIGISERILQKKGKLTKEEFDEIKRHPEIGVDIIRPIRFFHNLIPLILYHHERWDGKGYPFGLRENEIPVGARIIAVSDVYQALISDRPYRKAFSIDEAKSIIKEGSGTQFDPRITEAFFHIA
ncbi:MAG: diguanylate cyclase [Candidatus Omnitrophota bacterium]